MITFIVNEASGRGRGGKIWRALRREMLEQELPFRAWCTRSPGEATALAQLACQDAQELQKLVVVGGDGTVNEVLNGISDFSQIALGVVPIGSGNDFVPGLGLPRDPRAALERVFAAGGDARIDLGQMRINRFGLGSLSYGLMTLSAAWNLETARGSVQLTTPQGVLTRDLRALIFLACMNFPWEGGGVPIAPVADAADGCFSVCLADDLSRAQVFRKLPLLALGRHTHTEGVSLVSATRVEVQLDTPLFVHADGEVPGRARSAVFDVLPQQLRVLV